LYKEELHENYKTVHRGRIIKKSLRKLCLIRPSEEEEFQSFVLENKNLSRKPENLGFSSNLTSGIRTPKEFSQGA